VGFLGSTGQHFEIREEGDWWAAVPDEEWPDAASGQRTIILADFERDVGDRRQEIVFIGAGMDEVRARLALWVAAIIHPTLRN
jgi:G3E family GTPase